MLYMHEHWPTTVVAQLKNIFVSQPTVVPQHKVVIGLHVWVSTMYGVGGDHVQASH